MATKKPESFNAELDDLISGLDLPSDAEINQETGRLKNSLKNSGKNNPRYGVKIPPEQHPRGMLGKKHTEEAKRKSARPGKSNGMCGVSLTGEQNHMFGKTHTDRVKDRLAQVAANRKKDCHCVHCNGYFTEQVYAQYHGQYCSKNPKRIVKARKKKDLSGPQDLLTCPHCGYKGGEGNMKRYHMDACEFNGYYIASYQNGEQIKVYQSLSQFENDGINWHKVRNCILGKSSRAYKLEWKKIDKKGLTFG